MTPADARQILHEDAVLHVTELSVNEWTTRIAEELQLKEAADLAWAPDGRCYHTVCVAVGPSR